MNKRKPGTEQSRERHLELASCRYLDFYEYCRACRVKIVTCQFPSKNNKHSVRQPFHSLLAVHVFEHHPNSCKLAYVDLTIGYILLPLCGKPVSCSSADEHCFRSCIQSLKQQLIGSRKKNVSKICM